MTTPEQTRITLADMLSASDANVLGHIHGGTIMRKIDQAAGVAGGRFTGGPVVTAAMDEMSFLAPVRLGDVLHVHAQVNWAGRTSMEIGVRCEADRWDRVTDRVHVATAYLVMVAVDENFAPRAVPQLELVTADDHRRAEAALERRARRLRHREQEQARHAGEEER